jgi:catechol 2,3-dioxygenase
LHGWPLEVGARLADVWGMNQQMSPAKAKAAGILPAATQAGPVTLRVAEAERSLAWYRDMIGLELIERTPERLVLGAGGKPFLFLDVKPGTTPRVEETTGLYHLAILVPDRASLAAVLARIAARGVRLGASDHLVSEALYIWDPDGNGNEVYRDRPREEWKWENGTVRMATDPLNLQGLLADLEPGAEKKSVPAATRMGHVHLQVGDIDKAQHHYGDLFGLVRTAGRQGALFMSAGGYHHHLGCNIWHSHNAPRAPATAAGLVEFTIEVPNAEALEVAKQRFAAGGVATEPVPGGFLVRDPWNIAMHVLVAGAGGWQA